MLLPYWPFSNCFCLLVFREASDNLAVQNLKGSFSNASGIITNYNRNIIMLLCVCVCSKHLWLWLTLSYIKKIFFFKVAYIQLIVSEWNLSLYFEAHILENNKSTRHLVCLSYCLIFTSALIFLWHSLLYSLDVDNFPGNFPYTEAGKKVLKSLGKRHSIHSVFMKSRREQLW